MTCSRDQARAQVVRQDFYVTSGPVNAAVLSGNTLYLGGAFTQIGPSTGGGAPIDSATGIAAASFPRVTAVGVPATVNCVVPDGARGWYLGGRFSSVGGLPRSNLAHVLANNTVSDWNPIANGAVRCMALSGSILYAGGDFTSVGGQGRNRIAALDVTTGKASSWNPNADGNVEALAVRGSTVYAGGDFTSIGGQGAFRIVGLDATTGLIAAGWDWFNVGANGYVAALAVSGNTVYAGGGFSLIGGQARNGAAALVATTGHASAWNPNVNLGPVNSIAPSGSVVYLGGQFTQLGGHSRRSIAAVDTTTGLDTGWNPNPNLNSAVDAVAVSGGTVYAGGDFTTIGGQTRYRIAALDPGTGLATAWNPVASSTVRALAPAGGVVFAGGDFVSLNGIVRNHLAAVDVVTGLPTAWDPNANGDVHASFQSHDLDRPMPLVVIHGDHHVEIAAGGAEE